MSYSVLKNSWLTVLVLCIGLLTGCNVSAKNVIAAKPTNNNAATPSSMTEQEKKIKADLELKVEKVEVKSVHKLPYNDLFEVVLGNNDIVYTNAKTEFTLVGHMINNSDMTDLTQARIDQLSTVDFKSLPFAQSFKQVKGDGSRQIAVFEDPNCGYCKMFRHTLEKMNNLTIHTFVIDILGPNSTEIAKQLLCAKDQGAAWDNWMLNKKLPDNKGDCDTSVLEKNKALAQKLGVTGTPTIIFEDGSRIPGAADQAALEEKLSAQK